MESNNVGADLTVGPYKPPRHYEATEITTIVRAVLRAMGATLKNLFRKPVTVHYPDKERQYPSRYRGLLALTYDKETGEENCIGCRLCEYVCPPAVIKVEMLKSEKRNYAKTFSLELTYFTYFVTDTTGDTPELPAAS